MILDALVVVAIVGMLGFLGFIVSPLSRPRASKRLSGEEQSLRLYAERFARDEIDADELERGVESVLRGTLEPPQPSSFDSAMKALYTGPIVGMNAPAMVYDESPSGVAAQRQISGVQHREMPDWARQSIEMKLREGE